MSINAFLEDFTTAAPELEAAEPMPEDLVGYSLGYEAGIAASAAQNDAVQAELLAALESLAQQKHAANAAAMKALRPLFNALSSHVVPACLETTFHAHIVETLSGAASDDMNTPTEIEVNPQNVDGLSVACQNMKAPTHKIVPNPDLNVSEARISQQHAETSLDFQRLQTELTAALNAVLLASEEKDQ